MAIKSIRVSNFKSFKDAYVELDKLNILIGANASGKSNFLQIFRFLKDIDNYGLENAISLQGGIEYLRNTRLGASQNLEIEIVSDRTYRRIVTVNNQTLELKVNKNVYKFSIKFNENGSDVAIIADEFKQECVFSKLSFDKVEKEEFDIVSQGEIVISKNDDHPIDINYRCHSGEDLDISNSNIFPFPFMMKEDLKAGSLLLENPLFLFIIPPYIRFFRDLSIYDFDSKLPKKATPITGKAELEEDASNLAIVLKNISNDSEKKNKFSNLLREILAFVKDFHVDTFADKSLIFKLWEVYSNQDDFVPASLISDGTINIIALITALYFQDKQLIVIEEPERNIHPYLVYTILEMMKETSEQKQIITTTHNPEIVKYANLDNLILISRDADGFSQISKLSQQAEVKALLENNTSLDELYVQNLLPG